MPNSTSPMHLDIEDVFTLGSELQSRRKSQTCLVENKANYTNRAIVTFVDAVDKMNEEVLVPSRLKDLEVRENEANEIMPPNSDLYSLYQMLNKMKKDLFSSSLFHKTFKPVANSQTNSMDGSRSNSGRVTPTSLSRRSSYSLGNGATSPTNGSTNGSILNNSTNVTTPTTNRTSPTFLVPPNYLPLERKLSSPCVMSNSSNHSGDTSPELLSPNGAGNGNGSQLSLLPSLSLSYVSRATSLSSLLAASGNQLSLFDGEPLSTDERVQQITGCFIYHLSALYTLMGHFTKAANYIIKRYHEEMDNVC